MEEQRIQEGLALAEHIWWTLAKSIVKKAGELYKWTDEEWATAQELFGTPNPQYLNAITIATSQAIADTGATSIFIMEGTPCNNL
jgi:hypothetical protein